MPAATSIAIKSVKISIAVAAADFDLSRGPAKGTPGSKNIVVDYEFQAPGTAALVASFKAQALQKVAEGAAATPGGFVVISGRLGAGRIEEAGLVYQPPRLTAG